MDEFEEQATIQRIISREIQQVVVERRSFKGRVKRLWGRLGEGHLEVVIGIPMGLFCALVVVLLLYVVVVG